MAISESAVPGEEIKVRIDDRVRRKNSEGCLGVVKELRPEISVSGEKVDRPWLCKVLWDNGSFSYYDPQELETAK